MVTLCNKCVPVAETQSTRQHNPGFDKRLGVVDGHFVQDVISRTRELLDDRHAAGVEETATSKPCRIDERNRVDHQRVDLPLSDAVPKIGCLSGLVLIVLSAIRWDHAIFPVSAAVIAKRIKHGYVVYRVEDAAGLALPRNPHRLARHDRIIFVRPLVELLYFVPVLGFVHGAVYAHPIPRGRHPRIIHHKVVVRDGATGLLWTTTAVPTTRWVISACNRIPATRHVWLSVGQPRRCDLSRRRGGWRWRTSERNFWTKRGNPGGSLQRWRDRRLDAGGHGHHDIHLPCFRQRGRDIANDRTISAFRHPAGDKRFGGVERIVPVLVVAVDELGGVRSIPDHNAFRHELRVQGCRRHCRRDTWNRE